MLLAIREAIERRRSYCCARREFHAHDGRSKLKKRYFHIAYRVHEKSLHLNMRLCEALGILPKPLDREGDIVVSLTSFPARINTVWMAIDSIMRQTIRPNRVILNLTQEEFPAGEESLPRSIKSLMKLGLEVEFRECNLRSHLKYFYTIQENPAKLVVTIDDDLYYTKDTIERLMTLHAKYPDAICANRTRKIAFDAKGEYRAYNNWPTIWEAHAPSHKVVALGYGGVLYPCSLFCSGKLFDAEAIKSLCYTADDLWLKALEISHGVEVAAGDYMPHPAEIRLSRSVSLQSVNVSRSTKDGELQPSGNDRQWAAINNNYQIKSTLL